MKVIVVAKLAYLYVLYWLVGFDEEGFQRAKGDYLYEMGSYSAAAKAYQRALSGIRSASLQGRLGYCHLNQGFPEKALESFKGALEKKADPVNEIGLAWSYLGVGENASCVEVVARLRAGTRAPDPWVDNQLDELEREISGQR